MAGGWGVLLGDVYLGDGYTAQQAQCSYGLPGAISCSDIAATVVQPGFLTAPPDGLGLPELATGDFTRVGYDGVVHASDYYEPRILTLHAYVEPGDPDCGECQTSRENVETIINAWQRRRADVELVLFPLCGPSCDDTHLGRAAGFVGRPRVATVEYDAMGGATLLLRFDCRDQRAYILDGEATPGSGAVTKRLDTTPLASCATYDTDPAACVAASANPDGEQVLNPGSVEAEPDVLFVGPGLNPTLVNLTNGTTLRLNLSLSAGQRYRYAPADFRLYQETATGPVPVQGAKAVGGFALEPGANSLSYVSQPGAASAGSYATITYRPARLTV